jgi:O-antigen ligase
MTYSKAEKIFNIIFLVFMFTLVVGTPMIYTSITRSVFEVNKLLLLRFVLVGGVFTWFLKYLLFKDNGFDNKEEESYSLFGFRWKRIGLEIPILIWLIVNFISTIFSQNIHISIIGSYDRWEGIITVINYVTLIMLFAKLIVKEFQVRWICFGIITSTAIAAIYGVLQSAGFDFMHWSKDPTFRVFASINNPVHYCAYVAMTIPLGISLLIYKVRRYEGIERSEKEPIFYKAIQFFLFFLMAMVILLNSYFSTGTFEITTTFFILVFSWVVSLFIDSPKIKLPFLFSVFLVLLNGFAFNSQLTIPFVQVTVLLGMIWYLCTILNSETASEKHKLSYLVGFTTVLLLLIQFEWLDITRAQWVGFFFTASIQIILFTAPKWENSIKALLFICTGLIYYTQALSFSRATWIGFLLMMPLYYLLITNSFSMKTEKGFIKDFFLTLFMNGIFCLLFTFRVYAHNSIVAIACIFLFLLAVILLIRNGLTENERINPKQLLYLGLFLLCVYPVFMIISTAAFMISFKILLLLAMFWLSFQLSGTLLRTQEKIILMISFAHLQMTGISLFNFLVFFVFISLYYFLHLRHKDLKVNEKRWLVYFLLMFGLVISLPTIPSLLAELTQLFITVPTVQFMSGCLTLTLLAAVIYFISFKKLELLAHPAYQMKFILCLIIVAALSGGLSYSTHQLGNTGSTNSEELLVANNIKARSNGYKDSIKEARVSMWKSAIPWIKDYPLFGSGLDTIKFMYPVYRLSEYGIREGGHNFTPDRLHNEYLNMLCSKGIIGFIAYYIVLLLTWYLVLLKGIFRQKNSKLSMITMACITGAGIFLGQLIFNFGVVATLVLFYIFIGLGYALVKQDKYD